MKTAPFGHCLKGAVFVLIMFRLRRSVMINSCFAGSRLSYFLLLQ